MPNPLIAVFLDGNHLTSSKIHETEVVNAGGAGGRGIVGPSQATNCDMRHSRRNHPQPSVESRVWRATIPRRHDIEPRRPVPSIRHGILRHEAPEFTAGSVAIDGTSARPLSSFCGRPFSPRIPGCRYHTAGGARASRLHAPRNLECDEYFDSPARGDRARRSRSGTGWHYCAGPLARLCDPSGTEPRTHRDGVSRA